MVASRYTMIWVFRKKVSMNMKKTTAIFLVIIGAASYGLPASIVKIAYSHGFTPEDVIGSFVFLGAMGLWILSIPAWRKHGPISSHLLWKLLLSGTFSGLTSIFYNISLQKLPASLAVVLLFQFTWLGTIWESISKKEKPSRNRVLSIFVIIIGTCFAAGTIFIDLSQLSWTGILFGFLSAITYTGFLYTSGTVALEVAPIVRSALMMTGSSLLVFLIFPPRFFVNGSIQEGLWVWTSVIALFSVIVPTALFTKAIPTVGIGLASILGSIELPAVILMSALLLSEQTSVLQWAGILLILFGIILAEKKAYPKSFKRKYG